jgi:8-amino-7-oxononanoate synthase
MSALGDYRADAERSLSALAEAGLLRRLQAPHGIDLVSNDYLGLAEDPRLTAAMKAALETCGAGSGGSRLLRGQRAAFERVEERLASFCVAESALLFVSGYSANVGLLQALVGAEDVVLSDERNHASLIDGLRLTKARRIIYPHLDLNAVDSALRLRRSGRAFVITESVFSMDGDLAPLAELADLAETHGALLIVDEAHATGLYGNGGSGRVEALRLRDRVLATVHTGGKALGSGGAWVAGPAFVRDLLINRARAFIFSTAPLPALAAALEAALDILAAEGWRCAEVHRKAALLRESLAAVQVATTGAAPIVPVIVGDNAAAMALESGLREAGFDSRAVRPPTVPVGTARLRVTARYPVADADIRRFAAAVGQIRQNATARASA